jgi:hypothetical protein
MSSPLSAIGEGLWVAEGERSVLGSRTPLRMTVIDIGAAALLHSPIACTDALRSALEATLPIRCIVAPNCFHHLYAGPWSHAYPQAELHGAPGLLAKRADLPWTHELGDAPAPAWAGHLEQLIFRAMPLFNEVVFFHARSRSLILTDLAFNFQDMGWGIAGLFVRAVGAHRRFGPSRITRRLIRDRALGRKLVDRLLEWPFERIILSHGAIVESDAKDRLRSAFSWL